MKFLKIISIVIIHVLVFAGLTLFNVESSYALGIKMDIGYSHWGLTIVSKKDEVTGIYFDEEHTRDIENRQKEDYSATTADFNLTLSFDEDIISTPVEVTRDDFGSRLFGQFYLRLGQKRELSGIRDAQLTYTTYNYEHPNANPILDSYHDDIISAGFLTNEEIAWTQENPVWEIRTDFGFLANIFGYEFGALIDWPKKGDAIISSKVALGMYMYFVEYEIDLYFCEDDTRKRCYGKKYIDHANGNMQIPAVGWAITFIQANFGNLLISVAAERRQQVFKKTGLNFENRSEATNETISFVLNTIFTEIISVEYNW